MPKFCRLFIITITLFLFSPFVKAQGTTDYRFLEVIDSANKPVVDATIKLKGICDGADRKTNEKGIVERFPIGGGDCGSLGDFAISKNGYFTFRDIGLFSAPSNNIYLEQFVYDKYYGNRQYKIELLKIPQNKSDRKVTGSEEQKRELFWAVRDKDSVAVSKLLKAGISPNLTISELRGVWLAPDNLSAIIYSAALGDIETVKEFVKAGVDLHRKDSPANGILLYYLGANPRTYYTDDKTRTEEEKTNLTRFQDGVDFLMNAGADLTATTKGGETALMIAAENGDVRTVKILLGKDLPVNQADHQGKTALLYATLFNYYPQNPQRLELFEILLKKGANPNVIISNPDDSSDTYCTSPLMNAVAGQIPELVKLLLDNHADINLACKNGKTAFRIALTRSWDRKAADNEIGEILIKAGVDVNSADSFGRTNLMFAASAGSLSGVELLLKNGALINARDKSGATVLLAVSYYRETELVNFLLEHGADPNIANNDCETPLMRAAIDYQSSENIQLLVNHGAKVNFVCSNGKTALLAAVRDANVETVKKLLEVGADAKSDQGYKALEFAKNPTLYEWKKKEFEEIIKLLEAAGAR